MPRKDNLEALQDRLTKAEAIVSLAAKHKQAIQRGWDDTHANETPEGVRRGEASAENA